MNAVEVTDMIKQLRHVLEMCCLKSLSKITLTLCDDVVGERWLVTDVGKMQSKCSNCFCVPVNLMISGMLLLCVFD